MYLLLQLLDRSNKPSWIVLEKPGHLINQRAAQSECLIGCFPFILGDISEVHKYKFNVIILLIRSTKILFAPVISKSMIIQLKHLIKAHYKLFIKEFQAALTPKDHLMLHYPRIISMMGSEIWSETCILKKSASRNNCYINFCKTLSVKHQLYWYNTWKWIIIEESLISMGRNDTICGYLITIQIYKLVTYLLQNGLNPILFIKKNILLIYEYTRILDFWFLWRSKVFLLLDMNLTFVANVGKH